MSRPVVAYLSSHDTMPASATRRKDAFEHDLIIGYLGMGLHYAGRGIEPVQWDAQNIDWSRYEAAVIGTAWDYTQRFDAFLQTLDHIASQTRVLNPPDLIRWNARKTYMQELAEHGAPVIPTLWLDTPDENACRDAFMHFGCESIVIKPQVGAGAWRQVKLNKGDSWPHADALPPDATMVQPFLKNVAAEGEYSLLFFNRVFSHAVLKRAAAGDYRIQSSYGGSDIPFSPSQADIDKAVQVLAAVPGDLLYARVDMVRGDDGELKLIELEIIEPYLYPVHASEMGHAFARAYCDLIGC
jgi:glutathione synthase/RimK-type ligase-like ATP-grasp enzyme